MSLFVGVNRVGKAVFMNNTRPGLHFASLCHLFPGCFSVHSLPLCCMALLNPIHPINYFLHCSSWQGTLF